MIAGKPKQQAAAPAPSPAPAASSSASASSSSASRTGNQMDLGAMASKATSFLGQSGKLNLGNGGFLSALSNFKNMSPEVQNEATVLNKDLDDGANIPLSKLNGKKKALLVGINYTGTSAALRGCINDVKNVQKLIVEKFKFPTDSSSMRVLIDDGSTPPPTKANMIEGMK